LRKDFEMKPKMTICGKEVQGLKSFKLNTFKNDYECEKAMELKKVENK